MSTPTTELDIGLNFSFTPSQDWFSHNIDHWTALLSLIKSSSPRILEIGSWEGRSAVFLLTHLCKDDGEIVCIDHFDLFRTDAGRERFATINHNLTLTGKKFRVLSEFSVPALTKLLIEEMSSDNPGFDWVYVDGSHEADDTLLDGELAWRLARKDAIFIFDDYHWNKEPEESIHHPRRGIDAFLDLHRGEYERLSMDSHYQVVLRKLTTMRIGFLVPERASDRLNVALGYGINIAFAIDASYAMPATVAIRSIIEHTEGRISIYIIDCGLSKMDKDKLRLLILDKGDVTLIFLALENESLAVEMGVVWAKLDIHRLLPVERVLYLDADILARSSLKELWDTDLQGRAIAAVQDVGHPMGHDGIQRASYFNAGVLLMDLAKVRGRAEGLKIAARKMVDATFKDQDALNIHFADDWLPLPLRWNAQGLGTYAKYPSPDRENLDLKAMEEPSIVHFTGPVNPTMADVLNRYIQPVTSKPWGYAGAPGHPFQDEWWSVLGRTPWNNTPFKEDLNSRCNAEKERVIEEGVKEFREKVRVLKGA